MVGLHLRSSRGRDKDMQHNSLGMDVFEKEESSYPQRTKLLYHCRLSSFRPKLTTFVAVAVVLVLSRTTVLTGSRYGFSISTSNSSSNENGGSATYLRHEVHNDDINEGQAIQSNVTVEKVYTSACIKELHIQRNQQRKAVLDRIEILPNDLAALNTKVLCFIPIISTDHDTTALEVIQTWGRRCDKLLLASNATDHEIGAIKLDTPTEDWKHLWQKQRETMRHIWEVYGTDYDWFLKADLDTYVIMENLRAYLSSEEIQSKEDQSLILGRRISRREEKWYQGFGHNMTSLVDNFLRKSHNQFHYTMGGAGYVMNQKYLKKFYESMDEEFCLSSEQDMTFPEDVAVNFCMGNIGVYPYNTRDVLGRERFHLRSPEDLFNVDGNDKSSWLYKVHRDVGGIKGGTDCCSSASITFHHVKGTGALYDFEQMLYCKRKKIRDRE
ncbi:hypothetical protein ACHAXM_004514 [Skeletonema potamos]